MQFLCVILIVLLSATLAWAILLKRDIRHLTAKLTEIVNSDTNALLTTLTFDKDITALAKSINITLERDRRAIIEKIRAEADLKRAITNISHDLRTPLTSALGYLQLLNSSEVDASTRERYLLTICSRLQTLSSLMNSLFDFAQVLEGDREFNIQKVNLSNILRDVLSSFYAVLDSYGFTVDTDIPDSPVFCQCDEDALRRILHNLLENVCVHGKNHLSVKLKRNTIEITNEADALHLLEPLRIFDRFYTADTSRSGKNTGLGLAIVKLLLSRMNAHISADILQPDIFIVRVSLPLSEKFPSR